MLRDPAVIFGIGGAVQRFQLAEEPDKVADSAPGEPDRGDRPDEQIQPDRIIFEPGEPGFVAPEAKQVFAMS